MLAHSHVTQTRRYLSSHQNMPEEDDETMSTLERKTTAVHKPESTSNPAGSSMPLERADLSADSLLCTQRPDSKQEHNHTFPQPGPSYFPYQHPRSLPAGYSQPTPFPSQVNDSWIHTSFDSNWSGYPNSLPSYLNRDFPSCSEESCLSGGKSLSLPSSHCTSMGSLEQPLSLCSNPPSANLYHHTLPPYSCSPQGAACCAQCPAEAGRHMANTPPWPQYHPAYGTFCKFVSANQPRWHKHSGFLYHKTWAYKRLFISSLICFQIQATADSLELDTHKCEFSDFFVPLKLMLHVSVIKSGGLTLHRGLNAASKRKNAPHSTPLSLEQSKFWPAGLQSVDYTIMNHAELSFAALDFREGLCNLWSGQRQALQWGHQLCGSAAAQWLWYSRMYSDFLKRFFCGGTV